MAKEDRVKVTIYHKETDKNMWFRLDPSSLKVWHSKYRITMPDDSLYELPVWVIALHRAMYYADKGGISVGKSLREDTLPLFERWDGAVLKDWAQLHMNWEDVCYYVTNLAGPRIPDFDEGWVKGKKEIVEDD